MGTRRSVLPFVLAVFVLGSGLAQSRDEAGQPAPRFRAKTTTGEQFNNQSIKGKVVLFEFWTTWCKYCEEEAASVDNIGNIAAEQRGAAGDRGLRQMLRRAGLDSN